MIERERGRNLEQLLADGSAPSRDRAGKRFAFDRGGAARSSTRRANLLEFLMAPAPLNARNARIRPVGGSARQPRAGHERNGRAKIGGSVLSMIRGMPDAFAALDGGSARDGSIRRLCPPLRRHRAHRGHPRHLDQALAAAGAPALAAERSAKGLVSSPGSTWWGRRPAHTAGCRTPITATQSDMTRFRPAALAR